jgi:SAM-dependent methyltransferase
VKYETLTVEFWRGRIDAAKTAERSCPVRDAVAQFGEQQWADYASRAKNILTKYIAPGSRVLDMGCGLGDLYPLMPQGVIYEGFDLVPEFIAEARRCYPTGKFYVADLCNPETLSFIRSNSFDVVVGANILGTVGYAMGEQAWGKVMCELARLTLTVLFFSYQHTSPAVWRRVSVKGVHLLEEIETAKP